MSYTDLSAVWVYRKLITHQLLDQAAENDKVFDDLLTAAVDFDNDLRFNNAKAIAGEIAAGGTYKDLAQLDSNDVCQLGQSGTEVRVPADPTNVLGVATKQYVDALTMFQTQQVTSATAGVSNAFNTILSVTGQGIVHAVWFLANQTTPTTIKITIDGTLVFTTNAIPMTNNDWGHMTEHGFLVDDNTTSEISVISLPIDFRFNTSLLIEAAIALGNGGSTVKVLHSEIP